MMCSRWWLRRWLATVLALSCLPAWAVPQIERWQAPSGTQVVFVENHDLPILDVELSFPAGASDDPAGKDGVASLTHELLDLGAGPWDESALAERLADLGAVLTGDAGADRATVGLRTLSDAQSQEAALELLRVVLSQPQFPAVVLERERSRSIAALRDALTKPGPIAARTFWGALYPGHPYGREATERTLNAITRDDLLVFHRTHYGAKSATVAIVGDVSRARAEALAQQLTEALPTGEPVRQPRPPISAAHGERWIAHPSAQAHVLMGMPAIRRDDPDFFPLMVGNYTLGSGGFVSLLVQQVRDRRGLAYSVYSQFAPMTDPGPFEIGLQTKKEQAREAVQVAREVLSDFLANGPADDELLAAKQFLVGSFPLRLDSNRKLLEQISSLAFYGLPLDYLDQYTARIEAVTREQVRAAFARHIQPAALLTVVVGGQPAAAEKE